MTDRLDSLLRDVIHDLSAEADRARSTDSDRHRFALDATDRGYGLRNRRRGLVVVSVAMVTALALLLPYGFGLNRGTDGVGPAASPTGSGPDAVPTHAITDYSRPIELLDGWYLLGSTRVLNWSTGTYQRFEAHEVLPSPNGEWVATDVTDVAGSYQVTNLRTSVSHQYSVPNTLFTPQWSPDGGRLLFTSMDKDGGSTLRATVLDAATGQLTTLPLDADGLTCVYCVLTWLPSGEEIALPLSHNAGEANPAVPDGVQTFHLDGSRARSLAVPGQPTGAGAWSPDGRFVVARGISADGQRDESQLIDVASGAVLVRFPDFVFQAAWVDDNRLLVLRSPADGTTGYTIALMTREGVDIERWLPPTDVVGLTTPYPVPAFVARLGG